MGKSEQNDRTEQLISFVLKTDLDTSVLAEALEITHSDLYFLSAAPKSNLAREMNFAEVVAKKRELVQSDKNSSLVIQEAIKEFQTSKESTSVQQYIQKVSVELEMLMKGLKHPQAIVDLLTKNTAITTFYDIDFSEDIPKVNSFNYDTINSDFMKFIAEFDNPLLLLDRLNKLKINVSVRDIEVQREKATDLLNIICEIPEGHFQKAVSDLDEFSWLGSCNIIDDTMSNPDLNKDFITRLRILKKGGLTDEEKELLRTLNDDSVVCPSISGTYGLETVLDDKEFLKGLHIVLCEEIQHSRENEFTQEIIDKVKMLEEKGVLSKLITIFSSGITFSNKNNYNFENGVTQKTIMDSILLEHEHSEKKDTDKVVSLIELTYENLANKEFIMMRSFLKIFTIEDSNVVKDALELFQVTKRQIEALPLEEKKELFRLLRSNIGFFSSVPYVFAEVWESWLATYEGDVFDGRQKIIDIMIGILKLDADLNVSRLESAIRQNERISTETVRNVIPPIDFREGKPDKVGDREFKILPIDTIRIDMDHVVDQSMDIIQLNENQIRIQLFLTKEAWKNALEVLEEDPDDAKVFHTWITYFGKDFANAVTYKPINGLTISVSSSSYVKAMDGLVDIHVDLSKVDEGTYIQEINSALSYLAGLGPQENLISPTDQKSDEVLIKELYRQNTKEAIPPTNLQFVRKTIIDSYETFTVPERHKAFKDKFGSFATFHRIYDTEALLSILVAGGMFSSHQRYRQGMLVDGLSTMADFIRGGANSVFTRTFGENTPVHYSILSGANVIFDSKIWDRLDFYLYPFDQFGDTVDIAFEQRLSPEEYLSSLKSGSYVSANEQMFRRGIPTDMIRGIVVRNSKEKIEMITQLTNAGVTSVNGQNLDDFIRVNPGKGYQVFDLIDIAEGLPIGTTKERKVRHKIMEQRSWFNENKKKILAADTEIDDTEQQLEAVRIGDLKTIQIIDTLSQSDEFLKEQFESATHDEVAEYTISGYAILVGKQFDKYYYKKTTQNIFTDQEIRVGLSLHDIGKNIAFTSEVLPQAHHIITKIIAQDTLEKVGFAPNKAALMVDIMTEDVIDMFVQSGDSDGEMLSWVKTIRAIAKRHEVSVSDVFELLKMCFICYESAYTKDAIGTTTYLDTIGMFDFSKPGQIAFSPEIEERIERLRYKVLEAV